MRKRAVENGLEVTCVAGTSAVILSMDMSEEDTVGLLGFSIEREDINEREKYFLKGFKYFEETAGNAVKSQLFSTYEHPVQSFMWEDFTVKAGNEYIYNVIPVYGKPKFLEHRTGCKIKIKIPDENTLKHSVYFNRGVAGSLAYARKFGNIRPWADGVTEEESQKALDWLGKGLDTALLKFIEKAADASYSLRAAFYEFEYLPVLEAFKNAYEDRNVDVKIIYDSRGEEKANNQAINEAGIPRKILIPRQAESNKGFIAHNKFIILLKDEKPVEVWTGSTNITAKGIFGQCNVGHIIRDEDTAEKYFQYWEYLKQDPINNILDKQTQLIQNDITFNNLQNGITVLFSPRETNTILKTYAEYMDNFESLVCGMFPFSFSKHMKEIITKDTDKLKYIIIDKKDKNTTLVSNDHDNIIIYGTYLKDGLYDWLEETHSGLLLNSKPSHVGTNFIHNKVVLIDPLGEVPIVITGSANFSDNSILNNDENTIIIKGNKDLADLYFTEFVRIFNHYYARSKALEMSGKVSGKDNPLHLKTDYLAWVKSFYNKNALKYKRKKMFVDLICS
ncbi:phospholipase D-like domain-containing protein [Chryseobacterium aquaticum]|uniref:phospholipase D n=1 Tax=Chryseobacterium aquaticum subsp. greenlandense TaxID=345663 RepID=A0A117KD04_9FLAO|nr:phospholipase D-like domain-containing protein [Chryseobacterium aquaticum]KUJ58348.1 hypothetical protein AR686_00655 [Chryseobacterium aquaticum subsp. greenlandense]